MIYELKSNSKNILAGKYNSETKMLKITFSGTGTYKYPNVELEDFRSLEAAESTGKAVRAFIKGRDFKKM
jgi:hypothetical protein